jgi:hypothetical protein
MSTYIVNTNLTHDKKCELDMLENKKCAAYNKPWKFYIDQIEAGDIVFLYSNATGIIARGIATGITEIADYDDDEEHYMNLDRFEVFGKKPVTAATMREIVYDDLIFNQTVTSLSRLSS